MNHRVTIWKTTSEEEAFLLKSFLESRGISVFVKGQGTDSIFPDLPFSRLEVQVPSSEVEKAKALADEFFNWETVCLCESTEEALALKEFLESQGLKVYVDLPEDGEETGEDELPMRDVIGENIPVQVPAREAGKAREWIRLFFKSED